MEMIAISLLRRVLMRTAMVVAVAALFIGALLLPEQKLWARDCSGSMSGELDHLSSRSTTRGWIGLHRPDGEVIHIRTDQIVFVTSAANYGADKRALSRIQLLNGFSDVRENVEDVILAIKIDGGLI
jgi:hypothetical protein